MNYHKYDRVLEEFERNHPDIIGHVVDWYSNGRYEVIALLDDKTRVIYNELDGTARYLHDVDDANGLTEQKWQKLFTIQLERTLQDKRMTMLELSERSGVSRNTISSYINGKTSPNMHNLFLIAKALNVDVSELTTIN